MIIEKNNIEYLWIARSPQKDYYLGLKNTPWVLIMEEAMQVGQGLDGKVLYVFCEQKTALENKGYFLKKLNYGTIF